MRSQLASRWPSAALLIAVALGGCGDGADRNSDGLIVGTVTYRERVALPLNAIVEIRLERLAEAGAPLQPL